MDTITLPLMKCTQYMLKRIKKQFNMDWGIGILTQNPTQFQNKETKYIKRFWVYWDGFWYLTCLLPHLNEHVVFLNELTKCSSKNDVENLLISIIK